MLDDKPDKRGADRRARAFAWFVLYFFVAFFIADVVRDIPTQPQPSLSVQELMRSPIPFSDSTSFTSVALDLYNNKQFTPPSEWIIHLWPPGFMVLEALVLLVFGINVPFILVLDLLVAISMAILFALGRAYLLSINPDERLSLIPLVLLLFPLPRMFLLEPLSLILGEGFAIIFFLISLLLTLFAARSKSIPVAVLAGLALAWSAYLRSQFEALVVVLTAVAICIAAVLIVRAVWARKPTDFRQIRAIAIALLVAHVAMLPWRIHNFEDFHSTSWICCESLRYSNAGKTNKQLNDENAGWLVVGEANIACNLEPSYCGSSDSGAYYRVFREHAGEWVLSKLLLAPSYWFSDLGSYASPATDNSPLDFLANAFYLACVFATFPLIWYIRRRPDAQIFFWFSASFYAAFLVIFTLIQFETRYFYAMKIVALFSVALLATIAWKAPRPHRGLVE